MKGSFQFKKDYAVSEIVGGIILVLIAVAVFSVIYFDVTSKDLDAYHTNVKLEGSVNDEGLIVLEHKGGDLLKSYTVYVRYPNGTAIGSEAYNDDWAIGEYRYPLSDITEIKLVDETVSLMVNVYTTNEDGREQEIFSGELQGKPNQIFIPHNPAYDPAFPMLFSSLRNDTTNENLICSNFTENLSVIPLTYIYQWILNGNPYAQLLLPFDTKNNQIAKDYSGYGNHGTVFGANWTPNGIVGGAYFFNGSSEYIHCTVPPVFTNMDDNAFTISMWVKSSDIDEPHKVLFEASYSNKNFAKFVQYESQIHFMVCIDNNKFTIRTNQLANNIWYNIVGTWQGSTGKINLYFNGVIIDSTNVGERNFSVSTEDGFLNIGFGAPGGGGYFNGYIDEVEIYPRLLSDKQIYQNYLLTKDGLKSHMVIVSEETSVGQIWQCILTPNDGLQDGNSVASNLLQIILYSRGDCN